MEKHCMRGVSYSKQFWSRTQKCSLAINFCPAFAFNQKVASLHISISQLPFENNSPTSGHLKCKIRTETRRGPDETNERASFNRQTRAHHASTVRNGPREAEMSMSTFQAVHEASGLYGDVRDQTRVQQLSFSCSRGARQRFPRSSDFQKIVKITYLLFFAIFDRKRHTTTKTRC